MAQPTTITIDVSPTVSMVCPRNWAEAAAWIGTSQPTIRYCRRALDRLKDPLSAELFQEIGQMVRYCDRRNNGGGSSCTRQNYMMLKALGSEVLEKELVKQGVI